MEDTIGTATYSPEDNKLRLYPLSRLPKELYERVRAAGFIWAPKQELFVAPMWTPSREDFLIELCGEVGDEDISLVDRAEQRAERFEDYSDARAEDAESARKAVSRIADGIPMGQPILVGHHSERHARKDAEKIENGMRRSIKMWEQSQYWKDRAKGAIRLAKYKERPDVRARRIKGLEADARKEQKDRDKAVFCLKFWNGELHKKTGELFPVNYESCLWFSNFYDHISYKFSLADYPREAPASQYEDYMSLWSALGGSDGPTHAVCSIEQAKELAIRVHNRVIASCDRWLAHISNRLEYERAMLAESGGTVADRNKPEVGGGCKCWASPRGGWSYIQKVNKVSVTVLDQVGGWRGTRTMPFDKLHGVMSKAEVDAARAAGVLIESEQKLGFFLTSEPPKPPAPKIEENTQAEAFDAMRDTLKAGVQVVTASQLFPTPSDLARRMVELAEIQPGQRILEPSAGTGNILREIRKAHPDNRVVAVEINERLTGIVNMANRVHYGNFLDLNPVSNETGTFERILMNPPFENASDIKHIEHALTMLKPGGRLVAICANGPRQNEKLRPLATEWEELPNDTFTGTGVNAVLLTIEG